MKVDVVMEMLKKKRVIFMILIIIGIAVRIYNFPNALKEINTDEIMTIANAKSIVDTGKELSGISFPVYLQGWGGQSVILLYLMVLSIKIFGLSLFAIRLPMLLISIISLFVFYNLVKKITKNTNIALIALGLLAICPWHILQSIWALDCNMFPHFLLIAIDLLYTGIETEKKWLIYTSMVFFAISLYGYGVAIYFVPLFLACVMLYLLKVKNLKIKDVLICAIIFLIVGMPIITMFAINVLGIKQSIEIGKITIPYYEGLSRTKDMVFFSPNPLEQLGNNVLSTFKVIFKQTDGAEWNASEIFGATYRITMIFVIIGVIRNIKEIKNSKEKTSSVILLFWVSISFLTGLVVNEANINRLNSIWYVLLILAAYGIYTLYEKVKYKKIYMAGIIALYTVIFIIFAIYFHTRYVKIVDESGCFSRGFYQALNYINASDKTTVLYDNIKNDGCLELYIKFNNDDTKVYKSIKEEAELQDKIENISDDEVLIIDVEFKNYPNARYEKQIGDFIIVTN